MLNKHIATSLTSFHYNHPKIIQIQIQLFKTSPQPNKQSNKKLLPKTKLRSRFQVQAYRKLSESETII